MTKRQNISELGYMPQLDGLRAFAVAAVLYQHWIPSRFRFDLSWGAYGVQLFFVMSGFLITQILLRCRKENDVPYAARAFYARRCLRIFPLYYGVLIAAWVADVAPAREIMLWCVAYLTNVRILFEQNWLQPFGHFWTLAVEEQFYLFWPAVVLVSSERWLRPLVISLITVGLISRHCIPFLFPDTGFLTILPNANVDALGLGALIACIVTGHFPQNLATHCFKAVPLFILLVFMRLTGRTLPLHKSLEHILMLASYAWLVYSAAIGFTGPAGKILSLPWLRYLGRISYGIYVLHNFAWIPARLLAGSLHFPELEHGFIGLILRTVITLLAASLSWHYFESPINQLKHLFPYRNADIR